MEKNPDKETTAKPMPELNLQALKDLAFKGGWSRPASPKPSFTDDSSHTSYSRRHPSSNRNTFDRGSRNTYSNDRSHRSDRSQYTESRNTESFPARKFIDFSTCVEVLFYPEDSAFKQLIKPLKSSHKTYELFQMAQLVLEKPENFTVVLHVDQNSEFKQFYCVLSSGLPFETQTDALNYIFENYLDLYFETAQVEQDPPKGNFTQINVCGLTNTVLGPPNYHTYNAHLKAHYEAHCSTYSYERFISQIQTKKDPEIIQQWLDSMRTVHTYTLKTVSEGASPVVLDSKKAVKDYLTNHLGSTLIKPCKEVRLSGKLLDSIPIPALKRYIQSERSYQQKFPLITSNNLRGRLRRMGFNIYKKGSKGISYVCAIKRKYRKADTVFADPIKQLLAFLERTPMMAITDVPKAYLESHPTELETGSTAEMAQSDVATSIQIQDVLRNIHWLVVEGYITHYANGTLQVVPMLPVSNEPSSPGHIASNQTSEATVSDAQLEDTFSHTADLDTDASSETITKNTAESDLNETKVTNNLNQA